jgi:ornithine carbamoyltransferase
MHSELPPPAAAPIDVDALLGGARQLQRAGESSPMHALLRGKNLGLVCEAEDDEDARRFCRAAGALGARVSHIRPSVSGLGAGSDDSLTHTARVLGRLYDGLECQGLNTSVVDRLRRDAGVPVFDGLASPRHPTAQLTDRLVGMETIETKRVLVLQAALLFSLLNLPPTTGLALATKGTT